MFSRCSWLDQQQLLNTDTMAFTISITFSSSNIPSSLSRCCCVCSCFNLQTNLFATYPVELYHSSFYFCNPTLDNQIVFFCFLLNSVYFKKQSHSFNIANPVFLGFIKFCCHSIEHRHPRRQIYSITQKIRNKTTSLHCYFFTSRIFCQ